MARLNYVNYDKVDDVIKAAYDEQKKAAGGYVTNMKKTLLHSLPAYHALMEWHPLREEVVKFIGNRGVSVFCHSISSGNECLLCSLYFVKELKEQGISLDNFKLSEQEELLSEFGRQITSNPNKISDDFFENLKRYFTDRQIVNLVAFAAIMSATNLVNSILQVEVDESLVKS